MCLKRHARSTAHRTHAAQLARHACSLPSASQACITLFFFRSFRNEARCAAACHTIQGRGVGHLCDRRHRRYHHLDRRFQHFRQTFPENASGGLCCRLGRVVEPLRLQLSNLPPLLIAHARLRMNRRSRRPALAFGYESVLMDCDDDLALRETSQLDLHRHVACGLH